MDSGADEISSSAHGTGLASRLSVRRRDARGVASRVKNIALRYSITPKPIERRLKRYDDVTARFGVRPTFPITAVILARQPTAIRHLADRGVEFAVHGLVHNDHAQLSVTEQRCSIAEACRIFERAGIPYAGFRAPYLRHNEATQEALQDLGFRYQSSQVVAFDVVGHENPPQRRGAYEQVLRLYGALDAEDVVVRPDQVGGLVNIAVALPDDESMVERLRLDEAAQTDAWMRVLEHSHHRGELFTMQLHPERIFDCQSALETVLDQARRARPAIWVSRLDEIAAWWSSRSSSVLTVTDLGVGRHRVHFDGDPRARLLLRGIPEAPSDEWYGLDRVARSRSFDIDSGVKPVVGVAPNFPPPLRDFLREEGFVVEASSDPQRFTVYLDERQAEMTQRSILTEVERSAGPLVRVARWPCGARSAFCVTGDIDCFTLQDFAFRLWEARR